MIKVIGFPRSRSTRILWMLEELGQTFEYTQLDLSKAEHKSADFLALNPGGKVPVLIDDDLVLSECTAIVSYLGDRYGQSPLQHKPGSAERAQQDQWASFVVTELEQPLWTMGKHKFAIPKEHRVKEIFPTAAWEFQRALALFSEGLSDKPYILGEAFSSADILLGHTLIWGIAFEQPVEQKNLQDYLARLKERPALQRAIGHEKAASTD